MSIGKARKGILKNAVLVSVMAFYFSCGKDVFSPDSPNEMRFQENAKTASPLTLTLSPKVGERAG
jgi:hypothetical protein